MIRVWAMPSGRCVAVLQGHARDMVSIALSPDGSAVTGVGKDSHGRTSIVVWDVDALQSKSAPSEPREVVLARCTTEASVHQMLFSPIEERRLVSCGVNDIRFWRIKNKKLSSISVKLPQDQAPEVCLPAPWAGVRAMGHGATTTAMRGNDEDTKQGGFGSQSSACRQRE